jgi:hypothetical protein
VQVRWLALFTPIEEMSEMNNCRNYGLAMLSLFFLTLSISSAMGQDTSENNYPGGATMIQSGQAIQDSISKAGEIDYFVLPVDTSGIVSISLDGVPADMRARLVLTNEYTGLWTSSAAVADKTATNTGDSLVLVYIHPR